jgi:hypothetical protein
MKSEMAIGAVPHIEAMEKAKAFFKKCAKDIEKDIDRLGEDDPNADTNKLEDEQDTADSLADDLGDVLKEAKKLFK